MAEPIPLSRLAQRTMPQPTASCLAVLALLGTLVALLGLVAVVALTRRGQAPALVHTDPRRIVAILILILVFCVVEFVYQRRRVHAMLGPFYERNEADYAASHALVATLPRLLASPGALNPAWPGVQVLENLRVSQVTRPLDREMVGVTEVWLERQLALANEGANPARLDLGKPARGRPQEDGFVAILEDRSRGGIDTVRLVIPSETAARQYLGLFVLALGKLVGTDSHRGQTLTEHAPALQRELLTDIGYVSDRLSAIARLPEAERPAVAILGVELRPHILLGGALQFGGEDRVYQLFPIGLIQQVTHLAALKRLPPAGQLGRPS